MKQVEEIKELIEPVLTHLGLDLVDLQVQGSGNRTIVRVFIDEAGGISIDRCTTASRAIADILDQKDPIPSRYILEVSSPGTDRPLKTGKDFLRHLGKKVTVRYQVEQELYETTGIVDRVEDNRLYFTTDQGALALSLENILLCKLIVEF